jgi:hypothetical protein
MKSALLGLMILLGACSIQHRSDAYACTKQADCNSGRTCTDGLCVVPGSGTPDAPKSIDAPGTHVDASSCPAGCSTCNVAQKTCTIDCQSSNCNGQVACPAGYKCDIKCDTDNSCRTGVDCTAALSCNLTCSGTSSCRNVQCGLGPCDINCSGASSCRTIACNSSCACDVACTGNSSCGDTIQCTSFACKAGLGCTSVPTVCHSCP